MNNNLNFQFGMYEHATDSVIINIGENSVLIIRCKECNSSVTFDAQMILFIFTEWLRKHLFCMPN